MNSDPSILIVDDDENMAEALAELLREQGHAVSVATSGMEAERRLSDSPDLRLVVVDLIMPVLDGMTLLKRIKNQKPALPVLMMSGVGTIASAVQAVKWGAEDFITKPFEEASVLNRIERILELQSLRERVAEMELSCQIPSFNGVVTRASNMIRALELAEAAARTDVPILLVGETGTGKELFARLIHSNSKRASRPFIPVNCGALPRELIESELFGYRKGAFTGAQQDRQGLFVAGEGGTLLLDEIGEMPPEMQVKLLRALQERTVRPIGAVEEIPVDVRVIASTNRPTTSGALRQDLYYRLARITIELPPLRERRGDLPLLLDYFLRSYASKYDSRLTFDTEALDLLSKYAFPGNVRELDNLVEGLMATHSGSDVIHESDLRSFLHPDLLEKPEKSTVDMGVFSLERLEKYAIEQVLRLNGNNKTQACEILGIGRDSLYRKMRHYGISY
jgi:DNA-binding NtrC family response regulator